MRTVVYKLGGSLLTLPGLAERIRTVLAERPDTRPLLIVGGGAAADVVREWARIHHLPEEHAHWLALRSMMLNEVLVERLLPRSRIIANREAAEDAWRAGAIPILCAHDFLRAVEPHDPEPLPHLWDVTSDSIAAWVTLRWSADELVLLKSVPPPNDFDMASREGWVDSYFPRIIERLPCVRWCDLRGARGSECVRLK